MSAPERSPWLASEERLRVWRALEELGSALVGAEWQRFQLTAKFTPDGTFQVAALPPDVGGVYLMRWPVDDLRPWEQWTEPEL